MSIEKITDAEWRVMRVVWKSDAAVTSNEVIAEVVPETGWNPQTVRTLLARLVEKGVLTTSKVKGVLFFTPLVSRDESIRVHGQSFLERVFEGNAREMLVHFIRDGAFSRKQIDELRTLLDKELPDDE